MNPVNSLHEACDSDFLTFVLDAVGELFAFETNGHTKYMSEDIACATLLMCAFHTSAETIQMIEGLPSADRILARLGTEKGLILGEKINQMLKKQVLKVPIPPGVTITVAGDITENPFYGDKDQPQTMGGKPKAGTTYFLKYLTFSLVIKGHRYPVGFYPLTQLHLPRLPTIVAQELTWLKKHQLCDRVLLDRGFNDKTIYNDIDSQGTEFLMPLTRNKALNEVFNEYKPHITKREKKKGFVLKGYQPEGWTGNYRVVAVRIKKRKTTKGDKWKWSLFLTNMPHRPTSLLFIYRQRWGIETSYRQIHSFHAVTTSQKYGVRVFLMGLAVLMFGLWVHMNWQRAWQTVHQRNRKPKTQPTVNTHRFRISITLPQLRVALALAILTRTIEKNKKI